MMNNMSLRILRQSQWVRSTSEGWSLKHKDVLQFEDGEGEWQNVPIEILPVPKHPDIDGSNQNKDQ